MKNQKGITLVALIITIIVMLILAGVSISLVVGENGVLTQAQGAGYSSRSAELEQAVQLAMSDLLMQYYGDTANMDTIFTADKLKTAVEENGNYSVGISVEGELADNDLIDKYVNEGKTYECDIDLAEDASGNVKTPYKATKVDETASANF